MLSSHWLFFSICTFEAIIFFYCLFCCFFIAYEHFLWSQKMLVLMHKLVELDLLMLSWCFHSLLSSCFQDSRKRRRRSLVYQKKRRRLLPFIPSADPTQRLKQMRTLASALTALHMEFSDDLTYLPGMAPPSANQAKFEQGGMQVWI